MNVPAAMGGNERGAFLFGAVDVGGNQHAMPVHQLRSIGIVDDVDGGGLAFAHSKERAWGATVVADGGEDMRAVEFDGDRRDAKRVVGFGFVVIGGGGRGVVLRDVWRKRQAKHPTLCEGCAAELKKIAPLHDSCLSVTTTIPR